MWSCVVSWDLRFSEPIPLPKGKLVTLRDAGAYIERLPKAEHNVTEWQTAMHCLIEAAEKRGPLQFARLGVMLALNRNVERVFNTSRKDSHWGRRKLARDA